MTTTTATPKTKDFNHASWEKRASDLSKRLEEEDEADREENASALGLDGKHARSQAEAEERAKAKDIGNTKKVLDKYKQREEGVVASLSGVLGAVDKAGSDEETPRQVKYVTRDALDAGKRVITVCDTKGPGKIVLTQDLSNLQSATPANTTLQPKSYADDAENTEETPEPTIHRGLVKVNLRNLHQCTVVVKCKIITGTLEISHCKDVTVIVEGDDATVVTIQADLCQRLDVQFRDSPSGKNVPARVRDTNAGPTTTLFWGQDEGDRIYHAGVSNLRVATYRDGYLDLETRADYLENGAKAMGNATAEEVQFVTSVMDRDFVTEKVLAASETKGLTPGARPLTERELKVLEKKKSQIQAAMDDKLKGLVQSKADEAEEFSDQKSDGEDEVEEVYASTTKEEIDSIVSSVEDQKAKGNQAFTSGEYAQAILFYTMALDRAAELPDATSVKEKLSNHSSPATASEFKQLFPRHIVLSNRSACFLKVGHHEKALKDGADAGLLDQTYVKGIFRKGLALHAMGRYEEAIQILAKAQELEPKNKQIKQALQFAEVRMTQDMRKRMQI